MNDSIPNSPKQLTSSDSKLSNKSSTTDTDADQIQSPSPQKERISSYEEAKEALTRIVEFTNRRAQITTKINKISRETNDETEKRIELKRLIFEKPLVQEIIEFQSLFDNIDCKQALREFLSDISRSISCLKVFKEFKDDIKRSRGCFQKLQDFSQIIKDEIQDKQIETAKDMLEAVWDDIYQLPIHDPVLINEISKIEWIFRARDALSHSRDDSQYPYIQYCQHLKKAALGSLDDELIETSFYEKIKEELQKYKKLNEKVNFLSEQESSRAPVKIDIEKVKKLLQELKEFGFGIKEGVDYVKGLLKRSLSIEKAFIKFLNKNTLATPDDLKKVVRKIQKFPVNFPMIQEHLRKLFNEQKEQEKAVIREASRRIAEANRELYMKFLTYAEETSMSPDIMIPAEDIWRVSGEEMQKITEYSAELVQRLDNFKFEDFCVLTQQNTTRSYEHIKAELWLAKMKLLRIFSESVVKPSKPITFLELRGFLCEIKDYIDSLPEQKRVPFDEQMSFLRQFLQEIRTWVRERADKQERNGYEVFYGFIDVTKEIGQFQRQIIESLNKKRSGIENQTQEIDPYEKIEKKMKKHNELYESRFNQKSKNRRIR